MPTKDDRFTLLDKSVQAIDKMGLLEVTWKEIGERMQKGCRNFRILTKINIAREVERWESLAENARNARNPKIAMAEPRGLCKKQFLHSSHYFV